MPRMSKRQAEINEFYLKAEKKRRKAIRKPCPGCGGKLGAFNEWQLKCKKCKKTWYVDKLV
jgi:ribosomal protein S27AE